MTSIYSIMYYKSCVKIKFWWSHIRTKYVHIKCQFSNQSLKYKSCETINCYVNDRVFISFFPEILQLSHECSTNKGCFLDFSSRYEYATICNIAESPLSKGLYFDIA